MVFYMTTQIQKMLNQQKRLEVKIERQDFKLRQNKYYENQRARKARTRRLIQKGALLENTSKQKICRLNKPKSF